MAKQPTKIRAWVGIVLAAGILWGCYGLFCRWDEQQYLSLGYLKKRKPEFEKQLFAWFPTLSKEPITWEFAHSRTGTSAARGYPLVIKGNHIGHLMPSRYEWPNYIIVAIEEPHLSTDAIYGFQSDSVFTVEDLKNLEREAAKRLAASLGVEPLVSRSRFARASGVNTTSKLSILLVYRLPKDPGPGVAEIVCYVPSHNSGTSGGRNEGSPLRPIRRSIKIGISSTFSRVTVDKAREYDIDLSQL